MDSVTDSNTELAQDEVFFDQKKVGNHLTLYF